jgi:DUF4097 and DUF4098 domain-containing protein YvlB
MPTDTHRFPTDGPIHLHVRSGRGSVEVIAAEVTETVVEVTGRDTTQARVSASDDGRRVSIDVTRHRRIGNPPRLEITVRIPVGATVDLRSASATIATRGPLATAEVRSASGAVSVEQVDGDCGAQTASGSVELGTIGGGATLRSASGDLRVTRVDGRCSARTASGAIDIGSAGDAVDAATASGRIRVADAHGGVSCKATSGDVTVGVAKGRLVWLDLRTASGRTASGLQPETSPAGGDEPVVTVKVHTASGDIRISRSDAGSAAA